MYEDLLVTNVDTLRICFIPVTFKAKPDYIKQMET